jgi:hypothetical protein
VHDVAERPRRLVQVLRQNDSTYQGLDARTSPSGKSQ